MTSSPKSDTSADTQDRQRPQLRPGLELPPECRVRRADLPFEAGVLVEAVRDLVEATVLSSVDADERGAVAAEIAALTERLRASQRPNPLWMALDEDGRFEHLTEAGTGRLNPQAVRLQWLTPDGEGVVFHPFPDPVTGEVLARCTLTQAHVGPPFRGHGGIVATILDQVVGMSAAAVGKPGMTAGLDIRYKGATPLETPLSITARYTHSDGRKHFATGEIRADGVITASALGVFIGHPQWAESQ